MRQRDPALTLWLVFLALSFVWGSSFLFIKIGLDQGLTPFWLVTYRLWIAVLVLLGLARLTGARLPTDRRALAQVAFLGIINVAIPFSLITWGEQYIPSALAAILNGLVPLFTIGIAAVVLTDEPITLNRLAGLLIGFVGAVLLLAHGFEAPPAPVATTGAATDAPLALLGELAIVVACISYACSTVYVRARISGRPLLSEPDGSRRSLRPVEIAIPQNVTAALIVSVVALTWEHPASGLVELPPSASAWFAVLWLGALGSALAYLFYFRLVGAWGATRTTLVTYVMPIVGIALGVLVLGETIEPREILGTILIIGGIALVNSRLGARRLYGRTQTTPD
ncbi:MAG: DMT family transporter [Candidatus Limnocylindrales bacterium]